MVHHHHQRVSLHQCSFALVPHSVLLIGHSIDCVPLLGELQLVPWVPSVWPTWGKCDGIATTTGRCGPCTILSVFYCVELCTRHVYYLMPK